MHLVRPRPGFPTFWDSTVQTWPAKGGPFQHFLGKITEYIFFFYSSGCSSSLAALHLACESLRHGDTSLALSGGINLILHGVLPLGVVLSKDKRCKTFDECKTCSLRKINASHSD